jgi:hypothetical protein
MKQISPLRRLVVGTEPPFWIVIFLVEAEPSVVYITAGISADDTVPEERLLAFNAVKLAPLVAPRVADQVPEVIVPTEARFTAEVIAG